MRRVRSYDPDVAARELAELARIGRAMPPSFEAHGDYVPVASASGRRIGHVLPGRGLLLLCDLKEIGIVRRIPGVAERSSTARLLDLVLDEAATAVTKWDDVVAARAAGQGQDPMFSKASYTTVANAYSSLFRAGGGPPSAGTYSNIPGGAAMTRASTGAFSQMLANPGAGKNLYVETWGDVAGQQINILMLVDLLVAAGNILATTNASQTVSSTALTRYTSGAGVLATFEVTTQIGTTASNLTMTYTNQAGTSSQVTPAQAMTTSMIVQRLLPVTVGPFIQLAAGDTGVQAVASVQLSAAMTAGVFALNLYKPLTFMPGFAANVGVELPTTSELTGIVELTQDGSNVLGCLNVLALTNTTSTGVVTGYVRTVYN